MTKSRAELLRSAAGVGLALMLPKSVFDKVAQTEAETVVANPVMAVPYTTYARAYSEMAVAARLSEPVLFPVATGAKWIEGVQLIDHRGVVLFDQAFPTINLGSGDSLQVDFKAAFTEDGENEDQRTEEG